MYISYKYRYIIINKKLGLDVAFNVMYIMVYYRTANKMVVATLLGCIHNFSKWVTFSHSASCYILLIRSLSSRYLCILFLVKVKTIF